MAADPNQEHSIAESKKLGTIFIDEGTTFETLKTSYEQLSAQHAALLNERDTLKAELEKLQLAIKQLIRARYGRKSERLDPEQLQLALEGLEQDAGPAAAAQEGAGLPAGPKKRQRRPPPA